MNPTLTQYDTQNAVHAVDGYFIPRPNEITQAEREKAFARAKEEALANLELRMAHIQSLTYDQFTHERK